MEEGNVGGYAEIPETLARGSSRGETDKGGAPGSSEGRPTTKCSGEAIADRIV